MPSARSSKKLLVRVSRLCLVLVVLATASVAFAQKKKPKPKPTTPTPTASSAVPSSTDAPPSATDSKKAEAKTRFERAMVLFDKSVWDAALVEFLASRAAYVTRSNTQNAAICLRNLNRFDEALDMFETLEKEFPSLAPADKAAVDKEIAELAGLVGTVEVRSNETGALITIDGRERGATPAPTVRVAAGTHVVRAFKEGFSPVEKRVEVAGRQNVVVDMKLETLAQSGRLSVTEDSGKVAEVVVDNVVLGKTPFQGLVATGDHVVFLRGEGSLGTQPANATVRINQVTPIVLALEPLESSLRVEPTPSGATVAVDGVVVGSGLWDGRLRRGRHKVEVAQNGFLPQAREVDLSQGSSERVILALERDPDSPLWQAQKRARIFGEIGGGFPITVAFGGDVSDGGSASFPLGFTFRGHVGYELPSGLGFSVDAGYLYLARKVDDRATTLVPVGKAEAPGAAHDTLSLKGLLLGASGQLHRPMLGEKVPLLFRFGVGALLGNVNDRRSGTFTPAGEAPLDVLTVRTSASAPYLYLAPEIRIGYQIGEHLELSAGLEMMILFALSNARWDRDQGVVLGDQGLAAYPSETLSGTVVFVVSPSIGARVSF